MPRRNLLVLLMLFVCMTISAVAVEKTVTIQEPFGLAWGPDRVNYTFEFAQGEAIADEVRLKDGAGQPVAVQVLDAELWPDKSIKKARFTFLVTLKPDEKGAWILSTKGAGAAKPGTDLAVDTKGATIELSNAKTAIRLAGGKEKFSSPVSADKVPAPIQGVRLPGGKWIGKGWWQTDIKCTGYSTEVIAKGTVVAQVQIRYEFEGGKFYSAVVELSAGQDLAVVSEEFNLSEGKRYPMTGANGMKPDVQYGYVLPKFNPPEKALIWDWWSQTMATLPTPNAYFFSFAEGLQPDSAEFSGLSQYNNLKEGDGGLLYDKDGRFAYVNAYLQWGDEETLCLGLYNSKNPGLMLAIIGLQPSRWLHPDIDPHPDSTIQQYTQTNCITFERKKSGEAFFRAPTCLGKRVYGIGGMERTLAKHILPERSGPKLSDKEIWGSDLMQRHVRFGRLTLDTVKDWVLAYEEPSKYPRLYVSEGDRVRYESRRSRKPIEEVKKELEAQKEPTAADKKVVTDAIEKTRLFVLHFAQIDKGHMDYGIEEGIIADLAEDGLSSPSCTPEQAKALRKWLAAIVYFAIHPDFVPPREAGFAWGSANMMAQVQCRVCRIASLLPNHPLGKAWRAQLAKVVTLYVEDQVNEFGATLECPHYGGMAITMPVMGLAALASCGDVDLSRAQKRLRIAAHMRLATLLPPDVRGGFRSEVPEGDGYYASEGTFGPLAGFFQTVDPEMARNLAWGIKESNNDMGGHADSAFKLIDVGLDSLEPKLGSEHFPGYGFVMRNGFPRADETYIQAYAGSFSWGHGHTDRGTWVMYAKGAPLMCDFAAMYTPSMREQWMHPGGLTFNHDETVKPATDDPKNDWWHKCNNENYRNLKTAPFTVIEPRSSPDAKSDEWRFGEITEFRATPLVDFAEMKRRLSYLHRVPYILKEPHGMDLFDDSAHEEVWLKNPFTWTRRFVLVKDVDPLGPNYLVIRDDLDGNTELDPNLNLWCLADKMEVKGNVAVYTGQHGVDLHCYIAEPAKFDAKTRTLGHPCGFGFANYYKEKFGKDFREDQIQLQIPQTKKDGGYFVAMVPVKQGEAAPKFETIAGGKCIKVTLSDQTHWIILSKETAEVTDGAVKFSGTSGVIKQFKDGRVQLALLAAGKAQCGDQVLESKEPATKMK